MIRRIINRIPRQAIRAGSLGVSDQVVISGSNFLVTIVAARSLGPAEYGLFSMIYLLLYMSIMVQTALISSPHNVIGVSNEGADYQRYTGTVAILQLGLICAGALVLLIGATVVAAFDSAIATLILAMIVASAGWQSQEFTRRVLYTESRFGDALLNDSLTHGLRIACVGVFLLGSSLTGPTLFLLMGATYLVGAVLGLYQIRNSLALAFERSVPREHWKFGSWLIASELSSELPRYVTAGLVSSLFSVGAFGAYRAMGQLMHGFNVPIQAMNSMLRPRFARDAQAGPQAVWRTMMPIMLLLGSLFMLVTIAIIVLREPLIGTIFGGEYGQYASSIFLPILVPVIYFQRSIISVALQAFRQTRVMLTSTILGIVSGTLLGPLAMIVIGLPAAGAVGLISTLVSLCWLGWTWHDLVKGEETWRDRSGSALTTSTNQ